MVDTPPLNPLVSTEKLINEDGTPTELFQRVWAGQQQLNVSYDDLIALIDILNAEVQALRAINLTAGTGLNGGGNLTADRVFDLANTAVTAASYLNVNLTIDAQGRITAAADGVPGGIEVEDDAVSIVTAATIINFTGAGVTVTTPGAGQADVEILGGGGSGGGTVLGGNFMLVGEYEVATPGDGFIDIDLPDDFEEFYVTVFGTLGASNTGMKLWGSADGGATFESAGSSYKSSSSNGATEINLADGNAYGAGRPVQCQFSLSKDITGVKAFVLNGITFSSTSAGSAQTDRVAGFPQGTYNSGSYIIDAARVALGAGNMDDMVVKVWGVSVDPLATSTDVMHIRDEQVSGANGGSCVAGATVTRVLNTEVINSISGASLAANQFTLPAGTYDVWGGAPGIDCGRTRVQIYNVTDAAIELLGSNFFNFSTDNQSDTATVNGRIVITGTKVFELRHFTNLAKATIGLGINMNDGNVEIFGEVFIRSADLTTGGGGGGGASDFLGLTDTPAAYTGKAGQVATVNVGETALEFAAGGGGGGTGLLAKQVFRAQEQLAAGTHAGASIAGTQVRVINTVVEAGIAGASLLANQITLPAGTYYIRGRAQAFDVNTSRVLIYDVTNAAEILIGRSVYYGSGDTTVADAEVYGEVVLAATTVLELRHYTQLAKATNGLGNSAFDTRVDIYADFIAEKITTGAVVYSQKTLHVQDQKATGVAGGASSATTMHTRTLNTVLTNTIEGASLASNKITLPAGTYLLEAAAPTLDADRTKAFLYNVTDAANEIVGMSNYGIATDNTQMHVLVTGEFTITAEKEFELRHYVTAGKATNGLGVETGDGTIEVYTDVLITKIHGDVSAVAYDVAGFYGGVPPINSTILRFLVGRSSTFLAGLPNSVGYATTAPTSNVIYDIQLNGVSVGSMTFLASSNTATFAMATDTVVANGDYLDIITPANLYTMDDVAYNLLGAAI